MDIEKRTKYLHIRLTSGEVDRLQAGEVIGERSGLAADSKIIVAPLNHIQEDNSGDLREDENRLSLAEITPARARIDGDLDLTVFIPEISLVDRRTPGVEIERDRIETLEGLEQITDTIPPSGVIVHFGGSVIKYSIERLDP